MLFDRERPKVAGEPGTGWDVVAEKKRRACDVSPARHQQSRQSQHADGGEICVGRRQNPEYAPDVKRPQGNRTVLFFLNEETRADQITTDRKEQHHSKRAEAKSEEIDNAATTVGSRF